MILDPDLPADLDLAVSLLAAGAVIAVPTDTVHGLVCDPSSAAAVDRVFAAKARPEGMELSLLGDDAASLARHGTLDGRALALAERFWPGPLSLVVPALHPAGAVVPRGGSVSLRIPGSAVLRGLLRRTGPLASTSANRHGEPAARSTAGCLALLERGVAAVLDGPPSAGQGSTIIDLTEVPPRVLRAGPLPVEALRPYLGD